MAKLHDIKIGLTDGETMTVTGQTVWLQIPGTDVEVKFAFTESTMFPNLRKRWPCLTHYGSGQRIKETYQHWCQYGGSQDKRDIAKRILARVVEQYGPEAVLKKMRNAEPLNEPHKERKARRKAA